MKRENIFQWNGPFNCYNDNYNIFGSNIEDVMNYQFSNRYNNPLRKIGGFPYSHSILNNNNINNPFLRSHINYYNNNNFGINHFTPYLGCQHIHLTHMGRKYKEKKETNINKVKLNPNGSFDEKVAYFHSKIKEIKIHWSEGYENIIVDRDNILSQSIEQFNKINPYKELKIGFKGEVNKDSGGIIREWLTVLFSSLLDIKTNLFTQSQTDDISYLINTNSNISSSQLQSEQYYFIGKILSKAILENLTVNCCLNKLIYKIILNEKITLDDMIFIDKPLYLSFKSITSMNDDDIQSLSINYAIDTKDKDGKIEHHILIPNGDNIIVTKDNVNDYIERRINFLKETQEKGVEYIKKGMFDIIGEEYFKIFTSDELGLLINGTPFIDIDDWRINTEYRNYNDFDKIILDFWLVMEKLSQEDLGKFLQFATGSKSVPIGGFATLESNRGNRCRFCIQRIKYTENKKNFIIAHTCFNRIDLPEYPNIEEIEKAIQFVLNNHILGFGCE